MSKNFFFRKWVWCIPFLFGMMTLGMNYKKEGTDLVGQVYTLSFLSNEPPLELLFNFTSQHHGLYYAIYAYLYSLFGIEPISYIALIAFFYYFVFIFLLNKHIKNIEIDFLNKSDCTKLMLIAICSFSPIYICIARNLFAIVILLVALYAFKKKNWIIGCLLSVFAYISHEGLLLVFTLLILSGILNKLVLPKFNSIKTRNFVIIFVCIVLFFIGPHIFSMFGNYAMQNSITSEKYNDLYISSSAGDGFYKYVLILSMLGSLYALIVASLRNHSNNLVNSICITALFFVSALFEQKIFMVQRVMMFIPLFVGMSLLEVYQNKCMHFNIRNKDSILLLSCPAILLAQLFFWKNTFFGFI